MSVVSLNHKPLENKEPTKANRFFEGEDAYANIFAILPIFAKKFSIIYGEVHLSALNLIKNSCILV